MLFRSPPAWDVMLVKSQYEANVDIEDDVDFDLDDDWLTKEELIDRRVERERKRKDFVAGIKQEPAIKGDDKDKRKSAKDNVDKSKSPTEQTVTSEPKLSSEGVSKQDDVIEKLTVDTVDVKEEMTPEGVVSDSTEPVTVQTPRRSGRERRKPKRLVEDDNWGMHSYLAFQSSVLSMLSEDELTTQAMVAYWTLLQTDPTNGVLDDWEPAFTAWALKASKKRNDPDLPSFQEAMAGPHREEFKKAMIKEIRSLEAKETWQGVLKSTIPADAKVVPLTWVFRIKRLPNGDFSKFKARICVRGETCNKNMESRMRLWFDG